MKIRRTMQAVLAVCIAVSLFFVSCAGDTSADPNAFRLEGVWSSAESFSYTHNNKTYNNAKVTIVASGSTIQFQLPSGSSAMYDYTVKQGSGNGNWVIALEELGGSVSFSGNGRKITNADFSAVSFFRDHDVNQIPTDFEKTQDWPSGFEAENEEGYRPINASDLLGAWKTEDSLGTSGTIRFIFWEDGRLNLYMYNTEYEGTYEVNGARLHIVLPEYPMDELKDSESVISLNKYNRLEFPVSDGKWGSLEQLSDGFIKYLGVDDLHETSESSSPIKDFQFEINDGFVTITGYSGTDAEVVIPDYYSYFPVTGIAYDAFDNNTTIKSLTIPEPVRSIGSRAFEGSVLEEVVINTRLTAWQEAFSRAFNLKKVTINGDTTVIQQGAFSRCSALEEVIFPSTLEMIEESAFGYITALTELNLPASLKVFDPLAVSSSNSNHSVNLTVDSANPNFTADGPMLLSKDGKVFVAYAGDPENNSIVIPEGVEELGVEALDYKNLNSIELPSTLRIIREGALGNNNFSEITLPEGFLAIYDNAFEYNYHLAKIYIPASVTTIEGNPFNPIGSLVDDKPVITFGGTQEQWDSFGEIIPEYYLDDITVVCLGN